MRYANSGKFGVVIVLSAILLSGLNAQIIYTDKFFYRDFLDLGQNRGGGLLVLGRKMSLSTLAKPRVFL